jgi:hypothetical protein
VDDKALSELRTAQGLKHLDLADTDVSDEGLAALNSLPNLKVIDLSGTRVTSAGLQHLPFGGAQTMLYIADCDIDQQAIRELAARYPQCQIHKVRPQNSVVQRTSP